MPDPEIRILSCVMVSRIITEDGEVVDHVTAQTSDGDELGLAEALGMIELAKHTLVQARTEAAEAAEAAEA